LSSLSLSMQRLPIVNVLLVDDHPENLVALEAILGELGQNLVRANSGEEALRCLLHQDFAVILLDVQMPGMDGFETANLIRQRPRSRNTPIIFLTAFNTSDDFMVKGYSLGAVDYLFKPLNPAILTSKVTVFVELFQKTAEVERQSAQLQQINSELKRSEERFRLLSNCSPVGIFLMDTAGRYTYANPSCRAICGFSVQEEWQTDWTNYIHTDDRQQALADWSSCIQQGEPYSNEFRIEPPDLIPFASDQFPDVKWVHVRSSPMHSDQGELLGHVGTIEDITDRQQAEINRAQVIREQTARQQAEAANRMKDEFLAIVSHELRTPLNSILGWAQMLLNRKLNESTTERALQTIERNARSQAQLIEDILDVSQIIRGKLRLTKQPVKIASLIEAVIETVGPAANDKSIAIETDFDHTAEKVYGDSERIRQIIWNLLSNSIKFTPEQGRVTIKLSRINQAEHESQYQLKNQHSAYSPLYEIEPPASPIAAEYAQIQIADSGIGISPSFLPYVFDRFRQADSTTTRPYGGLGLGLAIVHHLVEQHHGTIWVESAGEGQGSTFTVNLPLFISTPLGSENVELKSADLYGAEPHKSESYPAQINFQNGGNSLENSQINNESSILRNSLSTGNKDINSVLEQIQILVVEDHHDTREFIAMVLQEVGATVATVASVRAAIRSLEQFRPDVLISDIGMPLEDGYMLMRKVGKVMSSRSIPAIALTAYARAEDQNQALAAGFAFYVTKPFEPQTLIDTIAKAVGRPYAPLASACSDF
jgi:PAS domain S-box-containing protein